jgi:hypothetical protein
VRLSTPGVLAVPVAGLVVRVRDCAWLEAGRAKTIAVSKKMLIRFTGFSCPLFRFHSTSQDAKVFFAVPKVKVGSARFHPASQTAKLTLQQH